MVDQIRFSFVNGNGQAMIIQNISARGRGNIESVSCDTGFFSDGLGIDIGNGESHKFNISCGPHALDNLDQEGMKKFDLKIAYYYPDSNQTNNQTMSGQLRDYVTKCP